jgi:4-hydroxybenzoate polyprenyltransferase
VLKFADYFFVLRPILFFPAWTVIMIGYLKINRIGMDSTFRIIYRDTELLWVCLTTAMLMGSGLIVNQLNDKQSDRLNRKLFLIAEGMVRRNIVILESILLFVGAIFISYFISPVLTYLYCIATVFFIVGYNYRPWVLKDRPLGSLIANGLMGVFVFAFGWCLQATSVFDLIRDVSPYFFYNTALYLLTTIPDVEGDRASGKRTLPVQYGIPVTIYLSAAFHGTGIIFSLILKDWMIAIPGIMMIIFYLWMIFKKDLPSVFLSVKLGLFFLAVMVGVFFPVYYLMIILFFILTRWYYKKRFHIIYPSFKTE